MDDQDLSEAEQKQRLRLIELCSDIVNEYGDLDL
jgi:hypothetical protein